MNAAIAQKLNVLESAIVRIEEWAHVFFVVVRGLGGRFVSKKVVKQMRPETKLDRANSIVAFMATEGVKGRTWASPDGSKVRVYYGQGKSGGFAEVQQYQVDLRALNHYSLSSAIRKAGLDSALTETTEAVTPQKPLWEIKGYASQLDYDMEDRNGLYYG